jgi:hypothetical protein
MEKSLNYQALYTLQDQILSHVMALENDFYLNPYKSIQVSSSQGKEA